MQTSLLKSVPLTSLLLALCVASCSSDPDQAPTGHDDGPIANAKPGNRAIVLAPIGIDGPLAEDIAKAQNAVRETDRPIPHLERLGALFVHRARARHDDGFYVLAARCAEYIEELDPGNPQALLLRGHALQSLHRFADAEQVARDLVSRRGDASDHGLLGDVLVDLGKLDAAADAYQEMLNIRPGLQSYARASHIRWLRGDLDGARQLIDLACDAGSARAPEALAWSLARSARLELQAGEFDVAQRHADRALELIETYAPALFVAGQVHMARGDVDAAVVAFERAVAAQPLPEHRWALADALLAAGSADRAAAAERALESSGHEEDPRSFALFLATRGRSTERALELVRRELESREDVHTLDALAWAHFAAGQHDAARSASDRAMAEGSADPRLLYHAGAIAAAHDRKERARELFDRATRHEFVLLPSERQDLQRRRAAL